MSNMSYCKFQNTLSDLRDCLNTMRDIAVEGGPEAVQDEVGEVESYRDEMEAAYDNETDPVTKQEFFRELQSACERYRELDELVLSDEEARAFFDLIAVCREIADEFEGVDA
jgi:hypothetical protein